MIFREYNFDGLIGPTHNYAGLAIGNLASTSHQNQTSSPKAAALQGLQKMKFVADLGIGQCVLPPLRRPRIELLHQLGFRGTPAEMIDHAWQSDPRLVAHCYSASSMWTANAATVSPSIDTADKRLHLTPANLCSSLHRSIEASSTARILTSIFADSKHFSVHDPLPCCSTIKDEGAANHTRLAPVEPKRDNESPGIEIFVYGSDSIDNSRHSPTRYPARQTLPASQAIARRHQLDLSKTFFWQQNPAAIDAGVFHNDVISVGNANVLLCHQLAYTNQTGCIDQLQQAWHQQFDTPLHVIEVAENDVSLNEAVGSYLFNSQLLSLPDQTMRLICPTECQENVAVLQTIEGMIAADNPIAGVDYLNLRQSMNNGGGPACLRLRVAMNAQQQAAIHQGIVFTESLHDQLADWINANYRDDLSPNDLRDPQLIDESFSAIETLARILQLPAEVLLD